MDSSLSFLCLIKCGRKSSTLALVQWDKEPGDLHWPAHITYLISLRYSEALRAAGFEQMGDELRAAPTERLALTLLSYLQWLAWQTTGVVGRRTAGGVICDSNTFKMRWLRRIWGDVGISYHTARALSQLNDGQEFYAPKYHAFSSLYSCWLFNDAVASSECVASDHTMSSDHGRMQSCLSSCYIFSEIFGARVERQ